MADQNKVEPSEVVPSTQVDNVNGTESSPTTLAETETSTETPVDSSQTRQSTQSPQPTPTKELLVTQGKGVSPSPHPASAVEGGREVSNKILYVGNVHKSVGEDSLLEVFQVAGRIQSVKILNDKNKPGFNYAFVEFDSTTSADMALHTLNGRTVNNYPIKLNWAYQLSTINTAQNPNSPSFNIFVGDLSPEVDDETLYKTFSNFASLLQAHVMWDMQTSRSRGYGFVTFGKQTDAELALQTMNGAWVQGRAIRCNWASHKQINNHRGNKVPRHYKPYNIYDQHFVQQQQMQSQPPLQLGQGPVISPQSYDIVLCQTPLWQTTVYLGNIAHFTQQSDLIPLLQNFGFIVDFKFHPERGCAFVKYDSHERAALAIVQLAGFTVNGRPLKCGWGKDRPPMGQFANFGRAPVPMYQRP